MAYDSSFRPEEAQVFEQEEKYGAGRFFLEIFKVAALAFVIIIPIRVFFFQPFFVQGPSMEPNFKNGEYLIIREFGYKQTGIGWGEHPWFTVHAFRQLERQQVAVFHPPRGEEQFFIKRVIGLPGETVDIRNGAITIKNEHYPAGKVLDESAYLSPDVVTHGQLSVTLGQDQYFVLGDNRTMSQDSRAFGPISQDHVTGKVLLRAWPVSRAALF